MSKSLADEFKEFCDALATLEGRPTSKPIWDVSARAWLQRQAVWCPYGKIRARAVQACLKHDIHLPATALTWEGANA